MEHQGRELNSILLSGEFEEEHLLKEMEFMLKVVSSEDKDLVLKKQQLIKELQTIRGLSTSLTEEIPTVSAQQLSECFNIPSENDRNKLVKESAVCGKLNDLCQKKTSNASYQVHFMEQVKIHRNTNNCAGRKDVDNQIIRLKENKINQSVENVNTAAGGSVSYWDEEEIPTSSDGSSQCHTRLRRQRNEKVAPSINEELASTMQKPNDFSESKDPPHWSSGSTSPLTPVAAIELGAYHSATEQSPTKGQKDYKFKGGIIPTKPKYRFTPGRGDKKIMDSESDTCFSEVDYSSQVLPATKLVECVPLENVKKTSSFRVNALDCSKSLKIKPSNTAGSNLGISTWGEQMQYADHNIPVDHHGCSKDRDTPVNMSDRSSSYIMLRPRGDSVKVQSDKSPIENYPQPLQTLFAREKNFILKLTDDYREHIKPRFSAVKQSASSQCVADDIDVNVSRSTVHLDKLTDAWPNLMKTKWKSMSAPELRCISEQAECRWLSQYDLPLSLKRDFYGKKKTPYGVQDFEEMPVLLWGEAAYKHYRLLAAMEAKRKIEMIKEIRKEIINKYSCKQKMLENIVKAAKAYYSNPTGKNRDQWKELKKEISQTSNDSITDLRHKLSEVPSYPSFFTYFIVLAQLVSLTVLCIYGNLAPLGILSQKQLRKEVQTFLGAETFHRWIPPNPWIGPPAKSFLEMGATFAPCLRRDRYVLELSEMNRGRFCHRCPALSAGSGLAALHPSYILVHSDLGVGWWGPPHCSNRLPGKNSIAHVIRPCCVDHQGTCKMMSYEHCNFLGGAFHIRKEHCVEVNCIQEICAISTWFQVESDPEKPWLPAKDTSWQWWRLIISLIYTFGILHCLILLIIQWLLMRPLETSAGWLRIMLVYILCGVAGQIVASIAQPYIPHVGSTSGVAGMIGEAVVELSQAWHLLKKPQNEVIKLACFLIILLLMGFLPYIQPRPCHLCQSLDCVSLTETMCDEWDLFG
ncbi:hypothetical protein C0Q70_09208 [Pomacea canaliculata]|uniref:Peptidase S54 rhomboid domain-containing protein n=1 Tax=Pomacea canaliculata TaxID=400727 RepID=A0A2T7P939_POMCA|nr:hypothetical protein C0Q70_09208 [Pomacea canaliculata]